MQGIRKNARRPPVSVNRNKRVGGFKREDDVGKVKRLEDRDIPPSAFY